MRRLLAAAAAAACLAAGEPGEQLPDPSQEARARALFQEIRCVVCQNETIDASEADLAGDLRRVVREQVAAGRSDGEIRDFMVARYGEFVLFRPKASPANALLWAGPFLLLLGGGGLILLRSRRPGAVTTLSAQEERELQGLLESPTEPDDRKVT